MIKFLRIISSLLLFWVVFYSWSFVFGQCTPPSNVITSNPTFNTVSAQWSAVSGAHSYQLSFRPVGAQNWSTQGTGNVTTATVYGLTANTTYEFRVRANCTGFGFGAFSDVVQFTTQTCLPPVTVSLGTIMNTTAVVNWSASSGAVSYQISFRAVGTQNWSTQGAGNVTSATIYGLTAGKDYEVRVRANCAAGGWSAFSSPSVEFTTGGCTAPSNLTTNNITLTGATVQWNAVPAVLGYTVNYRVHGAQTWNSVNVGTNNYALTGLTPNTTYEIRVRTRCGTLLSPWTTTTNFTTLSCPIPTNLTTTNISYTSATLNWNAVTSAVGYIVNYREHGSQNWISTVAETNNLDLTGLTSGAAYEFQVKTDCGSGINSGFSSVTNFTTLTCPIPIGLSTTNVNYTSATLNWNTVSGAVGYTVNYRVHGAGSWTAANAGTNSYALTGLTSGTIYEFRVQTDCGSGVNSDFSGIESFTTLSCEPSNHEYLLKDTILNPGHCIVLDAGYYPNATYLWSNGETTQTINICPNETKKYWVKKNKGDCLIEYGRCLIVLKRENEIEMGVMSTDGYLHEMSELAIPPSNGMPSGSYCDAGIFRLYFQDVLINSNKDFDDPTTGFSRRNVVCNVFSDLSYLLKPSYHIENLTDPYVNILIRENHFQVGYPPLVNKLNTNGGTFYTTSLYYNSVLDPTPGMLDGEAWKTIVGEKDSYFGHLLGNLIESKYYHGYIQVNFNTEYSEDWYIGQVPPQDNSLNQNQKDLYSYILRSAMRVLGINTLLKNSDGQNIWGHKDKYSRYDMFLSMVQEGSNPPVNLINRNNQLYDIELNSIIDQMDGECAETNDIRFIGKEPNPVELNVYKKVMQQGQFERFRTLERYIDDDTNGCEDSEDYLLKPDLSNKVQRYPTTAEAKVLCNLGYLIQDSYGTPNGINTIDYNPNINCINKCGIVGYNDYYNLSPGSNIVINLLDNDINANVVGGLELLNSEWDANSGVIFEIDETSLSVSIPDNHPGGILYFRYIPQKLNNDNDCIGNITNVVLRIYRNEACIAPLNVNCFQAEHLCNSILQTQTGVGSVNFNPFFMETNFILNEDSQADAVSLIGVMSNNTMVSTHIDCPSDNNQIELSNQNLSNSLAISLRSWQYVGNNKGSNAINLRIIRTLQVGLPYNISCEALQYVDRLESDWNTIETSCPDFFSGDEPGIQFWMSEEPPCPMFGSPPYTPIGSIYEPGVPAPTNCGDYFYNPQNQLIIPIPISSNANPAFQYYSTNFIANSSQHDNLLIASKLPNTSDTYGLYTQWLRNIRLELKYGMTADFTIEPPQQQCLGGPVTITFKFCLTNFNQQEIPILGQANSPNFLVQYPIPGNIFAFDDNNPMNSEVMFDINTNMLSFSLDNFDNNGCFERSIMLIASGTGSQTFNPVPTVLAQNVIIGQTIIPPYNTLSLCFAQDMNYEVNQTVSPPSITVGHSTIANLYYNGGVLLPPGTVCLDQTSVVTIYVDGNFNPPGTTYSLAGTGADNNPFTTSTNLNVQTLFTLPMNTPTNYILSVLTPEGCSLAINFQIIYQQSPFAIEEIITNNPCLIDGGTQLNLVANITNPGTPPYFPFLSNNRYWHFINSNLGLVNPPIQNIPVNQLNTIINIPAYFYPPYGSYYAEVTGIDLNPNCSRGIHEVRLLALDFQGCPLITQQMINEVSNNTDINLLQLPRVSHFIKDNLSNDNGIYSLDNVISINNNSFVNNVQQLVCGNSPIRLVVDTKPSPIETCSSFTSNILDTNGQFLCQNCSTFTIFPGEPNYQQGLYSLTYQDNNGQPCTTQINVTILPDVNILNLNNNLCTNTDIVLSHTVPNTPAGLTSFLFWQEIDNNNINPNPIGQQVPFTDNNGQIFTNYSITPLTAGPYTIRLTVVFYQNNVEVCRSSSQITLNIAQLPVINNVHNSGPICAGQDQLTLSLETQQPLDNNATISWFDSNSILLGAGNPLIISNTTTLPTGTYTVEILIPNANEQNCIVTQDFFVDTGGLTGNITAIPSMYCVKDINGNNNFTEVSTTTAVTGATYTWDFSNGSVTLNDNDWGPHTVTWNTPGTYTISVTISNNGCTSTQTQVIVVNSLPAPNLTLSLLPNSPASTCTGSNPVIVGVSEATQGIGTWSITTPPGISASFTTVNNNPSIVAVTGSNTTGIPQFITLNYTLTAFNTGCVRKVSININILPAPSLSLIVNPTTVCINQTVQVEAMSTANIFNWNFGGGTVFGEGTGAGPHTLSWNTPGTYTIGVTVIEGVCTATATAQIQVIPQPNFLIAVEAVYCSNETLSATATGLDPNVSYTYQWTGPDGWQANGNPITRNPVIAGTYTITISAGGCTASQTFDITVNPVPVVSIIASPNNTCINNQVVLTVQDNTAGSVYEWDFDGGTVSGAGTGAGPHTLSWNTPGMKTPTLIFTDANGCQTQANVSIEINSPPLPTVWVNEEPYNNNSPVIACAGKTIELSTTLDNNMVYSWSSSNPNIVFKDGNTGASVKIAATSPNPLQIIQPPFGPPITLPTFTEIQLESEDINGCTQIFTFLIQFKPCCNGNYVLNNYYPANTIFVPDFVTQATSLVNFLGTYNINGKVLSFQANLEVNDLPEGTNLTFTDCSLYFNQTSKLVLANKNQLSFYTCQLLPCGDCWPGIECTGELNQTIQYQCSLNLVSTKITKAQIGLLAKNGAVVKINQSHFIDNYTHIGLNNYNDIDGFSIINGTLTNAPKRFSITGSTLEGKLLNSCSLVDGLPDGIKPATGISAANVRCLLIGNTQNGIDKNIFKNIDYGVYLYTNAVNFMVPTSPSAQPIMHFVRNNEFKELMEKGILAESNIAENVRTKIVIGTVDTPNNTSDINLYGNTFESMPDGLKISGYHSAHVGRNSFEKVGTGIILNSLKKSSDITGILIGRDFPGNQHSNNISYQNTGILIQNSGLPEGTPNVNYNSGNVYYIQNNNLTLTNGAYLSQEQDTKAYGIKSEECKSCWMIIDKNQFTADAFQTVNSSNRPIVGAYLQMLAGITTIRENKILFPAYTTTTNEPDAECTGIYIDYLPDNESNSSIDDQSYVKGIVKNVIGTQDPDEGLRGAHVGIFIRNARLRTAPSSANQEHLSNIIENMVYLRPTSSLFGIVAGIKLENCKNVGTVQNNQVNIEKNQIILPTSTPQGNGIYLTGTEALSAKLECNTVDGPQYGFNLTGQNINPTMQMVRNIMDSNQYGLSMGETADLGQQGTSDLPSDNQWKNYLNKPTTYVDNSPSLTKFIVRNSDTPTDYNPGGNNGSQEDFCFPNSDRITKTAANPGATSGDCNPESGLGIPPPQDNPPYVNYLRQIAKDSTNYGPIHAAQTRYLLKRNLYRALRDIPALLPLDARFQQQFDSLALTNIAKFMQVEDLITDSLWTQARTVNATIIPQGAIEDQARTVNQIWIERLIARATGMYITGQPFNPDGPAFFPAQYAQISAIAYKCPFTDGPAVYLARAMKNLADKRNNYFIDDCPVYDPGYRLEQPKANAVLAPAFKLYPNPAREQVTLEAFLPENEDAKLEVIAVDGRTVARYDVQNGIEQIDARQWAAGVYLFRITLTRSSEKPIFMHKIIVLK